jgi:glutamine synthetase
MPPPAISGNAYDQKLAQLPTDWATAINLFGTSDLVRRIFPDTLIRNLVLTKQQELARILKLSHSAQTAIYLETV